MKLSNAELSRIVELHAQGYNADTISWFLNSERPPCLLRRGWDSGFIPIGGFVLMLFLSSHPAYLHASFYRPHAYCAAQPLKPVLAKCEYLKNSDDVRAWSNCLESELCP
jgi:hypothetical protein